MTKAEVRGYLIIVISAFLMLFLLKDCEEDNHEIIGSYLSGHLSDKSSGRGIVAIKLDSADKWIKFICNFNLTVKPSDFYNYISKGDSIFKNSYSDTIFVIRDGKAVGWKLPKKN